MMSARHPTVVIAGPSGFFQGRNPRAGWLAPLKREFRWHITNDSFKWFSSSHRGWPRPGSDGNSLGIALRLQWWWLNSSVPNSLCLVDCISRPDAGQIAPIMAAMQNVFISLSGLFSVFTLPVVVASWGVAFQAFTVINVSLNQYVRQRKCRRSFEFENRANTGSILPATAPWWFTTHLQYGAPPTPPSR